MICRAGKPFHQDLLAGYALVLWESSNPSALLTDLKTGDLLAFESEEKGKVEDLSLVSKYSSTVGKCILMKAHSRNFLMPQVHHTPEKVKQTFKLFYNAEADIFSHQTIQPLEAIMVWEADNSLEKTYDLVWDLQGVFLHQAMYAALRHSGGVCCFLLHENRVYLSIFLKGNLRFQNAFDCINTEDLMYYLLAACQYLNLSVSDLSLYGAGNLDLLDRELTNTYLGPIETMKEHTPLITGMPERAAAEFFPLLNAFLCA